MGLFILVCGCGYGGLFWVAEGLLGFADWLVLGLYLCLRCGSLCTLCLRLRGLLFVYLVCIVNSVVYSIYVYVVCCFGLDLFNLRVVPETVLVYWLLDFYGLFC